MEYFLDKFFTEKSETQRKQYKFRNYEPLVNSSLGDYIIGCNSASGIFRDKLNLHINLPKEIFISGLKS